jgi:hypothetical protein
VNAAASYNAIRVARGRSRYYYVRAPQARRGLGRAFWRVGTVLAVVVLLYVGLVQAGLIRNPFAWAVSGDLALARSDRPGLRVLFVGNSFTYENRMPSLVRQLARSGPAGPRTFVVQDTKGSGTLHSASTDKGLTKLLAEVHWNIVVLQEQSQLLSLPFEQRRRLSDPYARDLQRKIRATGARTVLFLTWGYKNGDRANLRDDSYEAMQARLTAGTEAVGAELGATIAPVGVAWAEVHKSAPGLALWASDGKHPSTYGSYLAACVFYSMLSHRDPTTNSFTDGIDARWATYLRAVAAAATRPM